MDYRDELSKNALTNGYERRDDSELNCEYCIHQQMCSGENCHFDRKWYPEELEKKYYHVNEDGDRLDDELYSIRDFAEMILPYGMDFPLYKEKRKWNQEHPKQDYRVRITLEVPVKARDAMEAKSMACAKYGFLDIDRTELNNDTDMSRVVFTDTLYKYRMPVRYADGWGI